MYSHYEKIKRHRNASHLNKCSKEQQKRSVQTLGASADVKSNLQSWLHAPKNVHIFFNCGFITNCVSPMGG